MYWDRQAFFYLSNFHLFDESKIKRLSNKKPNLHLKFTIMIRITRILSFLLLLVFCLQTANAQQSTFIRQPGYWTLGLNAGLAYQSSDVNATLDGWGVGLTLAKNLYYQPGAPFTFDLRGRALYDQSYGLDHLRSTGILNNETVSDYWMENGGPGYIYQNHKTHHGELALEGVLSFNQLRERTNIILALYGGVGLDWYGTLSDQKDADGNIYDYTEPNIPTSGNRQKIKSELINARDGSYETKAQGFGDAGNLDWMPAVGLELGYQLTPRFSVGLGHKLTFTRNDDFDGQIWENDNTPTARNDWHNYTNLHLRWIIDPYQEKVKPPVIEVTRPSYSPYTTRDPRGLIRAKIKNISSAMDVDYLVNGQRIGFDFSRGQFLNNFNLRPGKNDIYIKATNEAGFDEETVIIYLEDNGPVVVVPPVVDQQNRPTVQFTNPASSNQTVDQERYRVEAKVYNVANRNSIRLSMDGYNINDFNYDTRNNRVSANVILKEGSNNLKIRVNNNAGSDQDEARVTLRKEQNNSQRPVVNITTPSADPHTSTANRTTIKATIDNVSEKLNVLFKVNGKRVRSFGYDGRNLNGTASLKEGKNTILITAKNDAGEDSDQTVIYYGEEPGPSINAPTVNINQIGQPSIDPFNPNQCKVTLKAVITNIESKNDVQYFLDGQPFNNFTYDKASKKLSSTLTLTAGDHDVRIKATNSAGSDEDTAEVNSCTGTSSSGDQPIVEITTPRKSNSTTSSNKADIKASVKHVKGKSDITFMFNNRKFTNFSYDSRRGTVTAKLTLKKGKNTIAITGTNQYGQDSDEATINYKVIDVPKNPPTVNITSPKNNSSVQNASTSLTASITNIGSKNDLKLKVNGQSINNFSYDSRSKKLKATVALKVGKNTIEVTATNKDGSDDDKVIVNYKKMEQPKNPPKVNISKPRNNSTHTVKNVTLEASITNVSSKRDIQVKLNGKSISNFSYDARTKKVKAQLSLRTGSNTIIVEATNKDGSDSDQVKAKYSTPKPQPKPTVKITSPRNGAKVKKPTSTIKATVKGVTNKNDIVFKVNGSKDSRFTYDPKRKLFTANVKLKAGTNKLTINATNASGSASDQVTVTYQAPTITKKPAKIKTFSVSQPSVDPFDPNKAKSVVKATLENVTSSSQISLYLNNKKIRGVTYDVTTKKVNAILNLTPGTSNIKLKVSNKDGKDERSDSVSF